MKDSGGLAFSVHPGGIFTPLQRHLPQEEMIALGWLTESGEPSEMAKAGYSVSLMSPSERSVHLAAELGGIGRQGSVLEVADLQSFVDATMAEYGRIDAVDAATIASARIWP